jgi:hypothetical protein
VRRRSAHRSARALSRDLAPAPPAARCSMPAPPRNASGETSAAGFDPWRARTRKQVVGRQHHCPRPVAPRLTKRILHTSVVSARRRSATLPRRVPTRSRARRSCFVDEPDMMGTDGLRGSRACVYAHGRPERDRGAHQALASTARRGARLGLRGGARRVRAVRRRSTTRSSRPRERPDHGALRGSPRLEAPSRGRRDRCNDGAAASQTGRSPTVGHDNEPNIRQWLVSEGDNWLQSATSSKRAEPIETTEDSLEPLSGFEPETYGLRNRCSTN